MNQSPAAVHATQQFNRDTAGFIVTVLHEHGEYRHLRFQKPGERWGSTDIHTWPGGLCTAGDMGDGWTFERGLGFFGGTAGPNLHYWAEKLDRHSRNNHTEFSNAILRQTLADVPDDHDIPEHARTALIEELTELADRVEGAYGTTEAAYEELREFSFDYEEAVEDEDEEATVTTLRFEEYYEMRVEDYDFHFLWACLALNTVANLLEAGSDRVIRRVEAREAEPPFAISVA